MFCPNCGKELPQSAVPLKFCPHCGISLEIFFGPVSAAEEVKETAEEAGNEITNAAEEAKADYTKAAEDVKTAVQDTAADFEGPAAVPQEDYAAPAAQEEAAGSDAQKEAGQPEPAAESVSEDIPQTEPVNEVKAVPPESKKKSLLPIILAAVLALAAIAGYFIHQNLPSTKTAKLMSSAESHLMQDEYKAALDELQAARQLKPDNTDIIEAQADAYCAYARNFVEGGDDMGGLEVYAQAVKFIEQLPADKKEEKLDSLFGEISGIADYFRREGDYDMALEILSKMLEIFPDRPDAINREEADIYSEWTRKVLDTGDVKLIGDFKNEVLDPVMERPEMSALQPLYDEAAALVESDKLLSSLSELGAALQAKTSKNKRSLTVDEFYLDCLNSFGIYNPVAKWCLKNPDKLPLIADIEGTEDRIGMYVMDNTVYCYIGEYEGDMRSGTGVWFTYLGTPVSEYQKYYAYGKWQNDKPNGKFSIWNCDKPKNSEKETSVMITVDVKDGLYNGTAEEVFTDIDTFRPEYKDGKAEIIGSYEDKGTTKYTIALGDESGYYITSSDKDRVFGILGFGEAR